MELRVKMTNLLLALLFFTIVSCNDDSTIGTDQPEPPVVPEAVPAEINASIFENNNPSGESFALFNQAAAYAQTAMAQIKGGTILGQTYLEFTRSNESVFEDGTWIWTFTSSQSGVDMSVRTTAEELQNGFQWNVFLSGLFNGETVTEYQFLSGFVSETGDNGDWQYFSPGNSEQPVLNYQWNVKSETESMFTTIFRDSNGSDEQQINYLRNGVDNRLEYIGFSFFEDLVVYWNSENGSGYIDLEGEERRCWNESFVETACS